MSHNGLHNNLLLASCSLFTLIVIPSTSWASCTTSIPNGTGGINYSVATSEVGTCTLNVPNSNLVISNSGSIIGASASNGITVNATIESLLNNGQIATNGFSSAAFANNSTINNLTNSASIIGSGSLGGMVNSGTIGTINNTGTIAEHYYTNGLSNYTIGYIGDSITYGYALGSSYASLNPATRETIYLSNYYNKPINLVNRGISGSTSGDWVSNYLSGTLTTFKSSGVNVVSIMLGTNDVKMNSTITTAQYLQNMTTIINASVAAGFKVILNKAIWVVPGGFGGVWDATANTKLNDYWNALLTLVNGSTVFKGDETGFTYFQNNTSEFVDGVHPGIPGADHLGQFWATAFQADFPQAISVNALTNSGIINTLHNDGSSSIISSTAGNAIYNNGALSLLTNDGGLIHSDTGVAIVNTGSVFGLDNTNGTISSTSGTAMAFYTGATNPIVNSDGLITSASVSNGTLYVGGDVGNISFVGGTINNTSLNNAAIALNINSPQSGSINFTGVNLVSDGDTATTGHGIIVNASNTASVSFTNSVLRGRMWNSSGNLTLTFNNSVLTGNILLGSGNDILDVNVGTILGNIDLGNGNNSLIMRSDFTTNGTFLTSGATNAEIVSGTLIVNHAMNLGTGSLSVENNAALILNSGNIQTTGQWTNSGITKINEGHTLWVGNINNVAHGKIVFQVNSLNGNLETGYIDTGLSAVNLGNQTISVDYIGSNDLIKEARSLIATGTGLAIAPTVPVIDNSFLYDFSATRDSVNTNDIYLNLRQAVTLRQAADTEGNAQVSNVLLNELSGSSDPQIATIQNNLANSSSRSTYNEILESTQPNADMSSVATATSMTNTMFTLVSSQMETATSGVTGISSGDKVTNLHGWVQAIGSIANQGTRSGVDGYKANTKGGAFGFDTRNYNNKLMLGVSFGYGDTNIHSENSNRSNSDITSYQLMGYTTYELKNNAFINGIVAYGWNDNKQIRHNIGGINGLNANSNYDSTTIATRAAFGKNFTPLSHLNEIVLTPQIFTEYLHFNADSYTENGAGGANLTVGNTDLNTFDVGLGNQIAYKIRTEKGGILSPNIHANYKYNLLRNDAISTNGSFNAGGSTFTTNGLNPSNSSANIGIGFTFYTLEQWDFTANYDYSFKTNYNAHSGLFKASYKF